jgi:hypothetical protein
MSKANVAVKMPETRDLEHEHEHENEGEGNKTAARRYNDATRKLIEAGKVDEAARKAKDAVNGPDGEDLRRAEDEGMCHPTGPGKSHASNCSN